MPIYEYKCGWHMIMVMKHGLVVVITFLAELHIHYIIKRLADKGIN